MDDQHRKLRVHFHRLRGQIAAVDQDRPALLGARRDELVHDPAQAPGVMVFGALSGQSQRGTVEIRVARKRGKGKSAGDLERGRG